MGQKSKIKEEVHKVFEIIPSVIHYFCNYLSITCIPQLGLRLHERMTSSCSVSLTLAEQVLNKYLLERWVGGWNGKLSRDCEERKALLSAFSETILSKTPSCPLGQLSYPRAKRSSEAILLQWSNILGPVSPLPSSTTPSPLSW